MRSALRFFLTSYRGSVAVLLVVLLASAVAENLAIAALYPLLATALDVPTGPAGVVLDLLLGWVRVFPEDRRLLASLAMFGILLPVDVGLRFLREWLQASVSARITLDAKRRLFERLVSADYPYFMRTKSSDIAYRLAQAPIYLALALTLVATTASLAITGLMTGLLLFTIEWRVTLGILAVGLGYMTLGRALARRFSVIAGRTKQAAQTSELGLIQEFTTGVKDITIAGTGNVWAARFLQESTAFARGYVRDLSSAAAPGLVMELVVFGTAAVAAAILSVTNPDALVSQLPMLAVYGYAVRRLLGTLGGISRLALRLAGLGADVSVVHQALIAPPPPSWHRLGGGPVPAWRSIELRSVGFSYPDATQPTLDGVSFEIARGRSTAIVGPSGVGKSTVLLLLLRLLRPTAGRLELDGRDLEEVDRAAWLARVGHVGQELFMHRGSVADNIAFGRPASREAVVAAARAAHADEFIARLPEGYDSMLGDRGLTLSVGQRQRLAIARALVHDPEILLLDEPTSALDGESEHHVQSALGEMRGKRTLVIVAHRLSTAAIADVVVVLGAGRVLEAGSPAELLAQDGAYARIVERQLAGHLERS